MPFASLKKALILTGWNHILWVVPGISFQVIWKNCRGCAYAYSNDFIVVVYWMISVCGAAVSVTCYGLYRSLPGCL